MEVLISNGNGIVRGFNVPSQRKSPTPLIKEAGYYLDEGSTIYKTDGEKWWYYDKDDKQLYEESPEVISYVEPLKKIDQEEAERIINENY